MNPIAIVVPVLVAGGAAAYYFLTRQSATTSASYAPPPGAPAVAPGGSRAQSYLKRLSDANIAISMAKVVGGATLDSAKKEALATLDVVGNMANADLVAGRIVQQDMTNITSQIALVKQTIG